MTNETYIRHLIRSVGEQPGTITVFGPPEPALMKKLAEFFGELHPNAEAEFRILFSCDTSSDTSSCTSPSGVESSQHRSRGQAQKS